jgi:hypothetical protein
MEPEGSAGGSGASPSESTVVAPALDWLGSRGWVVARGLGIPARHARFGARRLRRDGPGRPAAVGVARLNPDGPGDVLDHALRGLTRPAGRRRRIGTATCTGQEWISRQARTRPGPADSGSRAAGLLGRRDRNPTRLTSTFPVSPFRRRIPDRSFCSPQPG